MKKAKYDWFDVNYTKGWLKNFSKPHHLIVYESWIESIGGEKNVFLRRFLKQFKLA